MGAWATAALAPGAMPNSHLAGPGTANATPRLIFLCFVFHFPLHIPQCQQAVRLESREVSAEWVPHKVSHLPSWSVHEQQDEQTEILQIQDLLIRAESS